MAFKSPPEIYALACEAGELKAKAGPARTLVAGGLAGAFIAFGGLFAIAVTSGLDPKTWGTLPQLFTGLAFSVGLMLVVVGGAELVTGGIAAVVIAAMKRRVSWLSVGSYTLWATVGAFAGALLVAYFLAVKSGVVTADAPMQRITAIATIKGHTESDWQIFLRGIGCNWLVCLAVWMAFAADDVAGKLLAIAGPITAFVAMGFDHLVANMFFLPAAVFAHVPGIGWGDVGRNLLFAGIGNAVGAIVFVACAYGYLYGRAPKEAPVAATTGARPVMSQPEVGMAT